MTSEITCLGIFCKLAYSVHIGYLHVLRMSKLNISEKHPPTYLQLKRTAFFRKTSPIPTVKLMLGLLEMEIALIVVFSITVTFKDIVCDSKMCPIKRIAPPRSPLAVRSVYTVLTENKKHKARTEPYAIPFTFYSQLLTYPKRLSALSRYTFYQHYSL